ncbi:class IV adenylate cyclase [Halobacteriales archaeon SW_7_71_33]|nr:MAG: class IV adenylate cyclase [Halobacteriales archaeon SW_7_71_33]
MYEVELKVRADHGAVRERLGDVDAERERAVRQVDTYYDAPDRSFAETDEALRIRRQTPLEGDGETVELTYKGPKVDDTSKTREEHETEVADGDAVAAALRGLGYEAAATVRKERERYAVGEDHVTLDRVADLGTFVEVETEVERESAVPAARDRLTDLLERLDLDPSTGIRTSYLGLLLEDSRE